MLTAPTVIGVFGALLCASALGVILQRRIAEQHRSKETGDHVRLIISILVTFTAVVLGLLISSVKSSYDQFECRNAFAGDITELDVRLREYGEDAAPIRAELLTYLGAAKPTTAVWHLSKICCESGPGAGQLGEMLINADMAIGKLDPPDLFHKRLVTQIENQMSAADDPTPACARNLSRHDFLESSSSP